MECDPALRKCRRVDTLFAICGQYVEMFGGCGNMGWILVDAGRVWFLRCVNSSPPWENSRARYKFLSS